MARYEAQFRTSIGYAPKAFDADSMDEAFAMAEQWSEDHWPCDLMWMSGPGRYGGDEGGEERAEADDRDPEGEPEHGDAYRVFSRWCHQEAPGEVHGLGVVAARSETGLHLLRRRGVECRVVVLCGAEDQMPIEKLREEPSFIERLLKRLALAFSAKVPGLVLVPPDFEQVDEKVRRDAHGGSLSEVEKVASGTS